MLQARVAQLQSPELAARLRLLRSRLATEREPQCSANAVEEVRAGVLAQHVCGAAHTRACLPP